MQKINAAPPKSFASGQCSFTNARIGLQTYKFAFCDEEMCYSISFAGKVTQLDIGRILEIFHCQLYKNCCYVIRRFLEQQHIEYTSFQMHTVPLDHRDFMNWAEILLKSCSCDSIGCHIGNAAYYYALIDHQKWINKDCCEGCYCAVSRTCESQIYNYHIIGQTFTYHQSDHSQNGYFAIRTNEKNNRRLYNVDSKSGTPVLPTFGCIDIAGILLQADSIRTARQAAQIAVL